MNKTLTLPVICLIALAAYFYSSNQQEAQSHYITPTLTDKSGKKRIPLTPERFEFLMKENEGASLKRITNKINQLATSIQTNTLAQHSTYTQFIDANADYDLAKQLLNGLKNIQNSLISGSIQYAMKCNDYFDELYPAPMGYGWIDDSEDSASEFPSIYFCRGFEDNVQNKIGWHFHELSHFHPPFGMDTDDHSYKIGDCKKWAISKPEKALDNAACITFFLTRPTS